MNIQLKLRPFQTPNYVSVEGESKPRQEGLQELPKFALNELSEESLSELCDQFRFDIFKKAGKVDPKK